MPHYPCYIDGAFVDGASSIESVNPATGEIWATFGAASAEETSAAVEAAYRAFHDPSWRNLTATARGKLLYKLADLLAEHSPRLAELETRDTGKIIRETSAQIAYIAEYYRYFAGLADKIQGAHLPIDKGDMEVYTRREPIGVVAAVVPWNSQLFLSAVKIGPALAAGCTLVLKTSEDGSAALLEFARLVDKVGLPKGVVNILCGRGEDCGRALTSHPLVARVAFTGGPQTAQRVIRNTAENLAVTSLELGGKSPVLVFADADLESAANAVVAGIFAAAGQSCVAGSRLIVEKRVYDEFLAILIAKAERIRIGAPDDPATEMGPVATQRQLTHIHTIVAASVAAGARVLTGGEAPAHMPTGFYYKPTILACPRRDIACMTEELFGPVLSVTSFETEKEAVEIANDTRFGLASGVFTRDLARAHRMIGAIRAGMVWVNTYRAISPLAPFGGYGQSGYGREGGVDSIDDYTRTKSVWIKTSDEPIPDPFIMR
ncbi:MAG: aldehyde dehydrogenase [Hyphomicrobiales bacterium]|nr:aldehyde dehydrogenase [Hyphomicrobiales bacterium]